MQIFVVIHSKGSIFRLFALVCKVYLHIYPFFDEMFTNRHQSCSTWSKIYLDTVRGARGVIKHSAQHLNNKDKSIKMTLGDGKNKTFSKALSSRVVYLCCMKVFTRSIIAQRHWDTPRRYIRYDQNVYNWWIECGCVESYICLWWVVLSCARAMAGEFLSLPCCK